MKLKAFFSILACIILTVLFNMKIGDIPPLGKFLNPFNGFWKNAETVHSFSGDSSLKLENVHQDITVMYDDQHIPHVFAKDAYDLYFAQGYVTAKDRLWQMDFQTRYASGRLAEVVGAKAIPLDQYQRRMGMVYGAEKMLKESFKDPKSKLILTAYADGVNAYINGLSPADYPLEFKILDYAPEPWTPLNSALLLKLMSATLAGGSDELYMTNILSTYGPELTNKLFPNYPTREDPIIPQGTTWNFNPLPIPSFSDHEEKRDVFDAKSSAHLSLLDQNTLLTGKKEEGLGSNNWAISSEKSETGKPMLANDPHLSLTLPSIWYQIQLKDDKSNSYGVSIPGAPCVIIGFNQHISWGVTNVGSDVLDWYRITFKDNDKNFYRYKEEWIKTEKKIEEIKVRAGKTIYDTVYYTHHGPISALGMSESSNLTQNIPKDAALKWVAHLPSNDLRTFYELNRASTYEDYKQALTYFTAPAQNFVYADNQNNIAITPNGYFPLKWYEQGKFVLDGSTPRDEWQGRIPPEQNPTVKNPKRGFVSSANQSPVDPSYPYYLNWEYAPYDRGHRINERLNLLQHATTDSLRLMQLDSRSVLADDLIDTLISAAEQYGLLKNDEKALLEAVKKWNHSYEDTSKAATIFDNWYQTIEKKLWSKQFNIDSAKMRFPNRDRTVSVLLDNADTPWHHSIIKPKQNAKVLLIGNSFQITVEELRKKYGSFGKSWEWGTVNKRNVVHLAGMNGLGSKEFTINGSGRTINAIKQKSGPSWRMVVALGDTPTAYGILPGGASGNPGSKFYDNQLESWINGTLKKLLYITEENTKNPQIKSKLVLAKKI